MELKDSIIMRIKKHLDSQHATETSVKSFIYKAIIEKIYVDKHPHHLRPVVKIVGNPNHGLTRKDLLLIHG